MNQSKKITIKEAIKQGYTLCGEDGDEQLQCIDEIDEEYLISETEMGYEILVYDKNPVGLRVGTAADLFENMLENSELSDGGWEETADFLHSNYKEEVDSLLKKIFEHAKKARVTNTYFPVKPKLILVPEN